MLPRFLMLLKYVPIVFGNFGKLLCEESILCIAKKIPDLQKNMYRESFSNILRKFHILPASILNTIK